MRSINFAMAYTQADIKTNIFMQLLAGTNNQRSGSQQALFETSKEPVWVEVRPGHMAQAHQGWSPLTRIPTIQG